MSNLENFILLWIGCAFLSQLSMFIFDKYYLKRKHDLREMLIVNIVAGPIGFLFTLEAILKVIAGNKP